MAQNAHPGAERASLLLLLLLRAATHHAHDRTQQATRAALAAGLIATAQQAAEHAVNINALM